MSIYHSSIFLALKPLLFSCPNLPRSPTLCAKHGCGGSSGAGKRRQSANRGVVYGAHKTSCGGGGRSGATDRPPLYGVEDDVEASAAAASAVLSPSSDVEYSGAGGDCGYDGDDGGSSSGCFDDFDFFCPVPFDALSGGGSRFSKNRFDRK